MKKVIIIFLALALLIPLVACNEHDDQGDKPDIIVPTADPMDDTIINSDKQFDSTTNFSYITLKAGYRTRPYFKSNAEFPENMFIYETNTPRVGDIKMYGYMDENFEKLSEPISLSPNVFTMGMAMINTEEGSYIVNSDFKNMVELCDGYALADNGIVRVSWRNEVPEQITVLTITEPDSYLVPVKVDTGRFSDDGKLYIYGYKTTAEVLSGNAADKDTFVISPVFEDARPFFNGLAAVKSDGLWGYIDQAGNTVIDFAYDYAMDFIDNSTFVFDGEMVTVTYSETRKDKELQGYWALIDTEGNQLTEFDIRYADDFYDGWATVGFAEFLTVKKTGDTYDSLRTFHNYINTSGEKLWEAGKLGVTLEAFKNGIAHVMDSGKNYFYDVYGRILFGGAFSRANDFSDGLMAVKKGTGARSWAYIDSSGLTSIDEKYLSAGDFNRGYSFVIQDFMKPGFIIDKLGNKYLKDLNLYGMTKFNDEGYALGYTIVDRNETTQEWLYYMIHIEGS